MDCYRSDFNYFFSDVDTIIVKPPVPWWFFIYLTFKRMYNLSKYSLNEFHGNTQWIL